jgi:hypothetical protein
VALPGAVWVVVDRRGDCIRYYHSTAGGTGREALVYLSIDVVSTNGRGEAKPVEFYLAGGQPQVSRARSIGLAAAAKALYPDRP